MMKVKVDTKRVRDSLGEMQTILTTMAEGSGNSLAKEIVKWGYWEAVSLAPRFQYGNSSTKRAIKRVDYKRSSKLVLNQPINQTNIFGRPRKDGPRDYHLWMHGLGGKNISSTIRSGDPKFMFTTAKRMEKRAIKLAADRLRKRKLK